MSPDAASLREKLARLGQAKEAAQAEDVRRFLELDPGERLEATLQHADTHLRAFGPGRGEEGADSDAETRVRMRRRLAGLR